MKVRILGLLLVWAGFAFGSGLPLETVVTHATKLEIVRDGRVSGSIGLSAGVKVDVIALEGDNLQVRYRSLSGRVPVAHTGLAARADAMTERPAAPALAAPAEIKPPRAPAAGPSVMARRLGGKLVRLERGSLQAHPAERLQEVKFYALYFSAAWCGPCRQFTPRLVEAYAKLRTEFPEFEVVFVSADQCHADLQTYMSHDRMAWPALRHEAMRQSAEIMRYAGDGIPCLVLVDEAGRVLSDSYRGGNYVGPQAVLQDTQRILRQYRERNPRPQS